MLRIQRVLQGASIRSSLGTMGACSVTMIEENEKRIVFDVGHFGNRDKLKDSLSNIGLKPNEIDIVVLSHLHWDHCLNVELFKDSQILLGEKELELGTLSGIEDELTKHFKQMLFNMDVKGVDDGYKITPSITVLSLGGHTAGSIGLLIQTENGRTVLAGDAIPNLRAYKRGKPDLVFYSLKEAIDSIQKVRNLRPQTIIPGHDNPFNDGGYIVRDKIDIILKTEREENIVFYVESTKAEEPIIYNH